MKKEKKKIPISEEIIRKKCELEAHMRYPANLVVIPNKLKQGFLQYCLENQHILDAEWSTLMGMDLVFGDAKEIKVAIT